jgi:outer membrane lipoprotein-sorting protein
MKRLVLATACVAMVGLPAQAPIPARAQDEKEKRPTAEELLDRMDANLTFETRRARMKMTVEGRRTRTYEIVSYGRGEEDAAIEYLSPARDRGTRMLKLGDELWIYLPGADRVQKISGHMLRQGMMGSDVSYEDLMTAHELRRRYASRVTGEGSHAGRPCWTLDMRARDDSVTYPRRLVCVDKETYIPLRQELYARSGMLLKTWTMSDVKEFSGGRRFPTRMTIEDNIRKGSITRIEMTEIEFGVSHPREIFSLRWLERR